MNTQPEPLNLLKQEHSPYLLQHAENPVAWQAWNEDSLNQAKQQDKPIFLSIGYSTCHWCHVMEEESFEDEDIAEVLNEHFIAIKVDREERPDIDSVYMSAVMSLTGSGGWPLSVFLTPQLKPFFGGTYFPPEDRWGKPGFKTLLLSIAQAWKDKRNEIEHSATSITDVLEKQVHSEQGSVSLDDQLLKQALKQFEQNFDSQHGGFGVAPKFPQAHNVSLLLRLSQRFDDSKALLYAEQTLQAILKGGIYDHLGYGVHRYSTDERWHVPHFEKMLYDQAILGKALIEAFQLTGNELYQQKTEQILAYVQREMTSSDGGFYSAQDADSLSEQTLHKSEGAFFVWSQAEVEQRLGSDKAALWNYVYGVQEQGNALEDPHGEFVGLNIFYEAKTAQQAAEHFDQNIEYIEQSLKESRQTLFEQREQRPKPGLDDKILSDWNGLMISCFAQAFQAFQNSEYLDVATKAADFILAKLLREDGRLLHRYRKGQAGILATLEDYAFFVQALLDIYQSNLEVRYLKNAIALNQKMIELFEDSEHGGFFMTGKDAEALIIRQKDLHDGALPSGNSVALCNLVRLAHMTGEKNYQELLNRMVNHFSVRIAGSPMAHAQFLIALDFLFGPSREVILVGDKQEAQMQKMIEHLHRGFFPNTVWLYKDLLESPEVLDVAAYLKNHKGAPGKAVAYVCQNFSCQEPSIDYDQFKKALRAQ